MNFKKHKIYIGEWEVCCNDMATMLINDYIESTNQNSEDLFLFYNCDESPNINYCPYCGKKVPEIKQSII